MSKFLPQAASQAFDADVKQAFQTASKLRDCVTIRTNVIGDVYNFRKMSKGIATRKGSSSDNVVPMDIETENIPCPILDWDAPEFTDIFDQQTVNFDERQELIQVISWALGRRLDQTMIDAMEAATSTAPVIAAGGTGMTLEKIIPAAMALTDQGVGMGDRYIAISTGALEDILNNQTITDNDYNTVRLLMAGTIDTFMGFKWKTIEAREEGGLPLNGNIRTCFAFHKQAIGTAIGMDMRTSVDWVPEKRSWLSNGYLKAGSCVRDVDGFVKIEVDES